MNFRSRETYLTTEQVARLLKLPEVTIQRWEHQGKIPCKIINNQVMFKKSEITGWAQQHDLKIYRPEGEKEKTEELRLSRAIKKGGTFYGIQGKDIYTAFQNSLKNLSFVKKEHFQPILDALLDREELNSTGIGGGIAIPHTRNRLDIGISEPYVAVFFLDTPLNFSAVDEEDVYVLFMIFTSTVKEHLKMLSKISFILQQSQINEILQQRNQNNNLISAIEQLENENP